MGEVNEEKRMQRSNVSFIRFATLQGFPTLMDGTALSLLLMVRNKISRHL